MDKKNWEKGKRLTFKNAVGIIFLGIILSLGLNFLFAVSGFLQSSETYNQVAERQFSLPLLSAVLLYGIWSPLVEEVMFRGIVYRVLKKYFHQMVAVFGSALIFGLYHGNSVQLVYGTIMGIVMALLYEKHQTLIAPILFHGAANTAIYVVTYFF